MDFREYKRDTFGSMYPHGAFTAQTVADNNPDTGFIGCRFINSLLQSAP